MSGIKPAVTWLLVLAIAVGSAALVYSNGYDQGFALAKAQGDAALDKQGKEHEAELRYMAESAVIGLKKAADELIASQAYGNQLAADLVAKRDELRAVTDKLTGEIQRVTTLYRRALDAQPEPLPPALFTVGFVRVWNSALFGTAAAVAMPSSSSTTSGADATPPGPSAADDLIAGVTRADLLANQIRNGEGYAACRAQLTQLIEWNTRNGRN
ncbi:DNA-packaging protein [Pseudomonas juntendi]|uniref:DNA-packaging protein n=1 Tax=Pseudomonas juntendi TaxID=2666183 RepID=A0A7W2LZ86_9PSED|nr:DNA-packaging protein [Pseudomonas juntendi]MBA6130804.1 DNA-packaging protein [Pseudomonas juntendi]MBA6149782.1 DNA-packaging protein [Pseudomonas juntendi]